MSKGGSSASTSSSGSSSGATASATKAAQGYTTQRYDAPANTLSSADARERESNALSNLNALNNISNQGITNRELQTSRVAQEVESNRFARNRNEANNSFGRSMGGGSTSATTGNDQSRERERQFQREMQQNQQNNQIALNAATRYQNGLSSGMQFANQVGSELRQGKNAREVATIDANSRVAAAGLQAQGNVLGSLFGNLGGAGSQNYRYWG